jgi:zinc transporter 1/2/3
MVLESTPQGRVARVISSVLISFAAGTFLYIAVVEVIVEEFEDGKNRWQKLNLLLLGFAFMSALAVWL